MSRSVRIPWKITKTWSIKISCLPYGVDDIMFVFKFRRVAFLIHVTAISTSLRKVVYRISSMMCSESTVVIWLHISDQFSVYQFSVLGCVDPVSKLSRLINVSCLDRVDSHSVVSGLMGLSCRPVRKSV